MAYDFHDLTVGGFVERQADAYGDQLLLSFKDREITYRGLNGHVNRVANGLLQLGVRAGDKVCLMLPNCPEFFYCWLALAKIGAVEVPINTAHRGSLLRYVIDHSDAETLIIDVRYLKQIEPIAGDLVHLKRLVLYPDDGDSSRNLIGTAAPWTLHSFAELLASSDRNPPSAVRPTDLLTIVYTSGTTGRAKGVMVSHKFALWGAWRSLIQHQGGEFPALVHYWCQPVFHAIHLRAALGPLFTGERLALSEGFSASRFWGEIRKYKASTFMFVGAMLPILWMQPARPDDADNPVRFATGNPVPVELHRPFEERFGLELLQEYAMTEAWPLTRNPPRRAKVGSSGKLIPGACELKVVDADDQAVPRNTEGEVVLRPREPYSMMDGYYKMPEETLRAFRNLWYHTGDRGYLDEDEYFFFASRSKDMIRRSGENVSAASIEQEVNSHPAVLESAAVAVSSDVHGHEIKILVVLKLGQKLSPEELLDFCQQRMAYFMVPRYVEFVESLPRTALLRLDKSALREQGITTATWDRERVGYRVTRD